jgi:uncharacterized protein (DUF433 family)
MPEEWTTAQAAYVLNESLDAFKKVIERGPIKSRVERVGGLRVRKFSLRDLVFLHAQRELKNELTPRGRARLYEALAKLPAHSTRSEVAFGEFRFEFGRHLKEVGSKLKMLEKLSNEIDPAGGAALIKGTRIEAFRIAALLDGGMTMEDVLRDYPTLSERQVLAAKAYAEINPKVGRPFPKRTVKSALRSGKGASHAPSRRRGMMGDLLPP